MVESGIQSNAHPAVLRVCDAGLLPAPISPHAVYHFGTGPILAHVLLQQADSSFLQAIWCSIFGYWTFIDIQQTLGGDAGECFFQIGSFNVCEATALLSIHSNLFWLMAQALLSRMFAPGKSNFVNSSVSEAAR